MYWKQTGIMMGMVDKQVIEAVGVFLRFEDEFLIMRTEVDTGQRDQWGLVGGNVGDGEDPTDAAVREVQDRVGFSIDRNGIQLLEKFELTYPEYEMVLYVFGYELVEKIELYLLEQGEYEFIWRTYAECLAESHSMSGLSLILRSEAVKEFLQVD